MHNAHRSSLFHDTASKKLPSLWMTAHCLFLILPLTVALTTSAISFVSSKNTRESPQKIQKSEDARINKAMLQNCEGIRIEVPPIRKRLLRNDL